MRPFTATQILAAIGAGAIAAMIAWGAAEWIVASAAVESVQAN